METITTKLEGVVIVKPRVISDSRGYFLETFRQTRYADAGIDTLFVQDNLSFSSKDTIRGLHYQIKHPQAKLVQVITGHVFDVVVDIRVGSPRFGEWVGIHLTEENHHQLFIPGGFAHGFCVLSKTAHFVYKCSDYYAPDDEGGIRWSDPEIGIDWPVKDPIISPKDRDCSLLSDLKTDQLPRYES